MTTNINLFQGGKDMSLTKRAITGFARIIVGVIVRAVTPKLEEELEKFLVSFHEKCLKSENPWDDMLSGFLLEIFDIEYEG